jgi:hypothetical protein
MEKVLPVVLHTVGEVEEVSARMAVLDYLETLEGLVEMVINILSLEQLPIMAEEEVVEHSQELLRSVPQD